MIDPTLENTEKVVAALNTIGQRPQGRTAERLANPRCQIKLDDGSLYADIVTPQHDEDFAAYWARAIDEKIADMAVKVISCEDQVGRLSRSSLEKHRRDVELLKAVCPEHAPAS